MQVNSSSAIFLIILITIFLISCGQQEIVEQKAEPGKIEESLVKANKSLVKSEDRLIEDFISRYKWEMKETGTGLRYMIYKEGKGPFPIKGNTVSIGFTVRLLNGEECYTSDDLGNKNFVIGQGGVETGLEEGILFLKKGDRAKFILPSHLAFGLVGDGNKIPAKATLVYDVELIDLK